MCRAAARLLTCHAAFVCFASQQHCIMPHLLAWLNTAQSATYLYVSGSSPDATCAASAAAASCATGSAGSRRATRSATPSTCAACRLMMASLMAPPFSPSATHMRFTNGLHCCGNGHSAGMSLGSYITGKQCVLLHGSGVPVLLTCVLLHAKLCTKTYEYCWQSKTVQAGHIPCVKVEDLL